MSRMNSASGRETIRLLCRRRRRRDEFLSARARYREQDSAGHGCDFRLSQHRAPILQLSPPTAKTGGLMFKLSSSIQPFAGSMKTRAALALVVSIGLLMGSQAFVQAEPQRIAAPTRFEVRQLGATGYPGPSVELRWAPPVPVDEVPQPIAYRVYRDSTLLATLAPTNRVLRVSLLLKGVSYRFSVAAVTSAGEGERAQLAAIAQMPPSMPLNLRAVPSNGSVTLTWDPPVDNGGTPIVSYEVDVSPSTRSTCAMIAPTVCVLSGLRNDQSYEFSVTARNSAFPQLTGVDSDPAFATPGALPSGPNDFRQVGTGSTSVMLAWARPTDIGPAPIAAYQISIFEDRGPNSPRELYAITTVGPATLSTLIEGLTAGYEYYFGVRAVTATGMGAMTENVIVNPIGLPAAPNRVDILGVGSGAVKVGWEEPDPDGGAAPSEYRITATPIGGGAPIFHICRTEIPYEECTTDEIVSGLTNGVTYSFTVAAKNAFGYGPDSTHPAQATPMGPPQRSNDR